MSSVSRCNAVRKDFDHRRGTALPRLLVRPLVAAVIGALASPLALAGTTDLGNGLEAVWALDASLTSGWRTASPNMNLVGPIGGGFASGDTGTMNVLNFQKWDNFTTLTRVVGEVNLKKDGNGIFVRAKAWDNLRLSRGTVPLGAPTNDYRANSRLSDRDFDTNLSKFRGVELLDLYAYSSFKISPTVSGDVKVGQHAVNYGESLFVPGINGYSVFDVNALRQPGTLLKEAILPVPQISASLELPRNVHIEGFYQAKWRPTSIDGCGTYWSPSGALNCSGRGLDIAQPGMGPLAAQWIGNTPNAAFPRKADAKPGNDGQFGVALKTPVELLDTEFGLYYVNYHTHVPALSVVKDRATIPGSIWNGLGSAYWDYSGDNIKILGASASTVLGGWAVAGEVSYTKDFPVSYSGVDFFFANAAGVGPLASKYAPTVVAPGSNGVSLGYTRKNKSQLNLSTVKIFGNVLGAAGVVLVGELAYQHWSDMGNAATGVRYGRGFEFGPGANVFYGGCVNAVAANCSNDGYFTSNAWGVRAKAEAEYPSLITDVLVKARLFVARDIKGWAADGAFSQGSTTVSVGARFEFMRKYYVDASYTKYNRGAHFDTLNDRDFLGLVVGASF